MKRICLAYALLFNLYFSSFSQEVYQDYSPAKTIVSEEFLNNENKWTPVSLGDTCRSSRIIDGAFEIISKCSDTYPIFSKKTEMDSDKDFEIETEIKFVEGEDNNALSLVWGREESGYNRYIFSVSGNGYYKISQYNNNWFTIKEWTQSDLVKKTDFNKLTVRKIGNRYYFFLNEKFVYTTEFIPLTGNETGFQDNQNTTMQVNYLNVSYLKPNGRIRENQTSESRELLKNHRWGGSISPLMGYIHAVGPTNNRWKGGWNLFDGLIGYRFLPNLGIETGVNVAYIKMDESNQVVVDVTDGYSDWSETVDKAVYISCPLGLKVSFPFTRNGKNYLTIGGGGNYVFKANSTNIAGFEPYRSSGLGYYARISYFLRTDEGKNEGMDFQIRYINDTYEGVWAPAGTRVNDNMLLFVIGVGIL